MTRICSEGEEPLSSSPMESVGYISSSRTKAFRYIACSTSRMAAVRIILQSTLTKSVELLV